MDHGTHTGEGSKIRRGWIFKKSAKKGWQVYDQSKIKRISCLELVPRGGRVMSQVSNLFQVYHQGILHTIIM